MTDKIEPALDPEEWAQGRYEFVLCPGLVVKDDGDGLEFIRRDNAGEIIKDKILYGGDYDFKALAAMALHFGEKRRDGREPFGFVRADAKVLRDILDGDTWDFTEDEKVRIGTLAARIEALLPPEGK